MRNVWSAQSQGARVLTEFADVCEVQVPDLIDRHAGGDRMTAGSGQLARTLVFHAGPACVNTCPAHQVPQALQEVAFTAEVLQVPSGLFTP